MPKFGNSNIAEGVAESWVEAEMSWKKGGWSWVEVGAWFSNTRNELLLSFQWH